MRIKRTKDIISMDGWNSDVRRKIEKTVNMNKYGILKETEQIEGPFL